MVIGVPKETKPQEYRAGLTPDGAGRLASKGHRVLCEAGLGAGSGFTDQEYSACGAEITSRNEVYGEAGLIVKVKEPLPEEYPFLREGQALFAYLHLAPNRPLIEALIERRVTALAYETLEDERGGLPLLAPMSEVAGRMSPIMGAYFLQKPMGGRGVLPTGAKGVPPARIAVLGAGTVGGSAIEVAHSMGMEVWALNRGEAKLRALEALYKGKKNFRALAATEENIREAVCEADIVIGAVLVTGARAPVLINRELLKKMLPGAVIVDVAVDQGGCAETSRPTTHSSPTFIEEGIVHYCVANMPGAYPRTSTLALTGATIGYIEELAGKGIGRAMDESPLIRSALNIHDSRIVHQALSGAT